MKKMIKRILSSLMVAVIILTAAPLSGFVGLELPDIFIIFASAASYSGTCGENLTWTFDDETGELVISGTGTMENYLYSSDVPWYSYRESIKSVSLPNGLTNIGDDAFCFCTDLKSINIPDSVTRIGSGAFYNCTCLTNITIPDSVIETGWSVFENCDSLISVSIGSGMSTIAHSFFDHCDSLTNITIPDGITIIDDCAFESCDSLTSVTIPNSVTQIRDFAFRWCERLTNVTFGNSVTYIGDGAFACCSSLNEITIPNGVTTIGGGAFSGCSSLTSITVPDSVITIGSEAFHDCDSLTSIDVSANNLAYSSLDGVLFNKDKSTLIQYPIGNMRKLYSIPTNVTTIADEAFYNCDSLTNITLPNSVPTIGSYTFYDCDSLESITIPNGITTIGDGAFLSCDSLISVAISDSVSVLGNFVFSQCRSLENVTIGCGITTIGENMFRECTSIASITIPDSVTTIGYGAFSTCYSLANITIPDNVTTIDNYAFSSCSSISEIIIPDSVISIGNYAFWNCNSLEEAIIPASVNFIGNRAFSYCHSLKNINVSEDNIAYSSIDGVLFDKNKSVLIVYPEGRTNSSCTIPKSVTAISDYAFHLENVWFLTDVYYRGTKAEWQNVAVGSYNEDLLNATIHFLDSPQEESRVTYNYSYNGGSSATKTSATVEEGNSIDLTPTATKSGWTFVGWNTDPNATIGLSSLTMDSEDITLYAIYKKTLTATFIDYSGTTKKTRTATATIYNNATSGTVSAPTQNTYTGWTKCGWTKSTVASASAISSYSISADTTYYGLYSRTLTLSYNKNGGNTTPSSQTGTQYANSYAISSTKNPSFTLAGAISKSGSTFGGWAANSTSGTKYSAGSSISISSNVTMYATWQDVVNVYNLGEETYSFENYIDSDSYGHCFGMSITSSGYFLGELDVKDIGIDNSSKLYMVSRTSDVQKAICYYQPIQGRYRDGACVAGGSKYLTGVNNIRSDWEEVVDYVKDHRYDNAGKLQIGFTRGTGGHAINFLRYEVVNGQERIYAYDNNFPTIETYFYMSGGKVYQAPKSTFGDGAAIDCIALRDMDLYFKLAENYDASRYIYGDSDMITIEGAIAYPMECGDDSYTMFELPEGTDQIIINPLVDNATFDYMGTDYSFGKVDDDTYGVFVLSGNDASAGGSSAQLNVMKKQGKVNSVSIDNFSLNYKASTTVSPSINVDSGVKYTVSYSSSNDSVATVDTNGKVTAKETGSATITVTVTDEYGNIVTDTCEVNVSYQWWQWIIVIVLFGWIWY